MTRWLTAALPLLVAVAASWVHFSGSLDQSTFRSIFLFCSVLWFVLALRAQSPN